MKTLTPLGWKSIIGYGLGDLGNGIVFSMGLLFLLNYYTDVAQINAAAIGTMLLIVRFYSALMDIVVGRLIDRSSGFRSLGKFRPYLLWGAVPLLMLNVAVYSVPSTLPESGKLVYAYLSYMLLVTAYSFVNIPYGSLASAITQVPRERSLLSASRALMATTAIILLAFVIGPVLRTLRGEALQLQLTQFTLGLGVLGIFCYVLCALTTKEVVEREIRYPTLIDSLYTLRTNHPLQLLCITSFFILAGVTCTGGSAIFFARYVLGDAKHFTTIVLITTVVGALVSVPLAPLLAGRYGKRLTFQGGVAIAGAAHLTLFWLPVTNLTTVFALLALGSIGTKLAMVIFWALESDTVEYGEWRTGMRLEGTNYSLFALVRKLGQAMGGAMPAFLLAIGAYVPNLNVQNPTVVLMIRVGVTLVPALAFFIAFLIMLFYPLSDRRYLELIEQIKLRKSS